MIDRKAAVLSAVMVLGGVVNWALIGVALVVGFHLASSAFGGDIASTIVPVDR